MHLTSWPSDDSKRALLQPQPSAGISPKSESDSLPSLSTIIRRLETLFHSHRTSSNKIQTHLLHLSSQGAIGAHVDNIDASGSIIMGVSLGSARVLRMVQRAGRPSSGEGGRHVSESDSVEGGLEFQVLLKPGSVYIQR